MMNEDFLEPHVGNVLHLPDVQRPVYGEEHRSVTDVTSTSAEAKRSLRIESSAVRNFGHVVFLDVDDEVEWHASNFACKVIINIIAINVHIS